MDEFKKDEILGSDDAVANEDLATLTQLLDDGRRRKEEVDGR